MMLRLQATAIHRTREKASRSGADRAVLCIEPDALPPGALGNVKGMQPIFEKKRQFQAGLEQVHGISMSDPLIAGNWFTAVLTLDATAKGGGRVRLHVFELFYSRAR